MLRSASRLVGLATAGYGALSLARPSLMAKALGQTDAIGDTPPAMVMLSQTLGARDLASGLAIAVLPPGRTRTGVMATHVVGDVVLGAILSGALVDPTTRRRVALACYGWAGVLTLTGLAGATGRAADRVVDTVTSHRQVED